MEVDNFENAESESKFYLANQRLLLTYKTHIDKQRVKDYFKESWNVKEIHICHEMGDIICPYEHSHVYVDFGRRFQSRNCRVFDWEGIHPNIKKVKSKFHVDNCYKYLAKEDPDCAYCLDLASKKFDVVTVLEAPSALDAMRAAKNANDAVALGRLHDMYALEDNDDSWDLNEEVRLKWWPWQKEIIEMVKNRPTEDNLIWWIWDPKGRNGKTTFSKNMWINNPKDHLYIGGLGSSRDVVECLIKGKKNGWRGRVVHINLTRQNEQHSIYNALEGISDGVMTRQKYDGGTFNFKCHWCIVYANWPPEVDKLSIGKWRIKKLIGMEADAKLVDVDANSMVKCYDDIGNLWIKGKYKPIDINVSDITVSKRPVRLTDGSYISVDAKLDAELDVPSDEE